MDESPAARKGSTSANFIGRREEAATLIAVFPQDIEAIATQIAHTIVAGSLQSDR
jgi:hypothetical protein